MDRVLTFPVALQGALDVAIDAVVKGISDRSSEQALAAWLESEDAYEALTGHTEFFGVYCDFSNVTADEIRGHLDLGDDVEPTAAHRAEYVRTELARAQIDADANLIEPYLVKSSSEQEAYVTMLGTCNGQAGFKFAWHGLFKTPEALVADLQRPFRIVNTVLNDRNAHELPDEELSAALPI